MEKDEVTKAMADVEEKVRAFTDATKGDTAEEILAQMRGEKPYSDDLEAKSKEIATKWKAKGLPYNAIHEAVLEMAQWQRDQLLKASIPGEWWRCGIAIPSKYMNTEEIKQVKVIIIQEG